MQNQLKNSEKRAYQEWQALCERIRHQTNMVSNSESEVDKTKRIKLLLSDFSKWCKYYFPHYMDAEFGWFHKKAAKEIIANQDGFFVLEWAREHAKSVFSNVLMPLYLKAKNELTGMVVASSNQDKAKSLIGGMQAELQNNLLYINDYGQQAVNGSWSDSHFITQDGIGFWSFGRGQSPRGVRVAQHRPNYAVVDDIDDKKLVKNEGLTVEAVEWVLEDLLGCLSIKGARFIVAGNRIHKKSVLAHLVGDIKPSDPKREGIIHIKVYALENSKHEKDYTGQPAWKERYTVAQIEARCKRFGFSSARKEFFHEHIEKGLIFKYEWIRWRQPFKPSDYDGIVTYCDPSFKHTKDSDYKAVIVCGKKDTKLDILFAWVRKESISSMVAVFYDLFEVFGDFSSYYIESNMLQDLFLDEFKTTGDVRGFQLPIYGDGRPKPDKNLRIENLSPLFERGHIFFNANEKDSSDMQELITQLMVFPTGSHDDAPDALEGAVHFLQKLHRYDGLPIITGKYIYSNKRK